MFSCFDNNYHKSHKKKKNCEFTKINLNPFVRTRFESLSQKMDKSRPKVQNNEFVESGLENWAKMS